MDTSTAINVASGLVLVVLGGGLLLAAPARPGGRAFALFLAGWGGQAALFGLASAGGDRQVVAIAAATGLALTFAIVPALVHFALAFPMGARPQDRRWLLAWCGLAAAGALAFALDPDAFLRLRPQGDFRFRAPAVLLALGPFFAATTFAFHRIARSYERAASGLMKAELAVVLAALGLNLAYVAPQGLATFSLQFDRYANGGEGAIAGTYIVLFGVSIAVVLGWLWRFVRRPPAHRGLRRALVAALAFGLLTALPVLFERPALTLPGTVRTVAALLLAYAVLKHRVFGLDRGLKQVIAKGAPVAAFALAAIVAYAALAAALGASPDVAGLPLPVVGAVVAGGVASAVAAPARLELARSALPRVDDSTGYDRQRALEIYQASLEQAFASGAGADDPILPVLRRRLGLTDLDHEALVYVVGVERAVEPAPAPAPAPATERYEREALLKRGSLVEVWTAKDRVLDRKVVLKVFLQPGDPTPVEEARMASALKDPHIVTVYDLLQEDGRNVLVLELAEGGSLQDRLDREGTLPLPEALRLCADVLRGLVALHALGAVHQDVKPANVLLTREGRAKLSDFGVAHRVEPEALGETVAAGAGAGTVLYMSPEQAAGKAVDATSDLYAVAATLHRCVTGRHYLALDKLTEFQARRAIVEDPLRLEVVGQPELLRRVLERGLAKERAQRFATAGEMLAELERLRASLA